MWMKLSTQNFELFCDEKYHCKYNIDVLTLPFVHIFLVVNAASRRTVKLLCCNSDQTRRWKTKQHHYHVRTIVFVNYNSVVIYLQNS